MTGRIVVDVLQYFAERSVDRNVDVLDRIPDGARLLRVVPRMVRIVQVPALVPDAVAFAENLGEEVPFAASKEVLGDLLLETDSTKQLLAEIDETLGVAVSVADRPQWVAAETCLDLLGKRRGPRDEPILHIVGAPFDQLHAVQIPRQPGKRDIEHGHLAPGAAQVIPERLALELVTHVAAIRLV
jgi:hypothetical protein